MMQHHIAIILFVLFGLNTKTSAAQALTSTEGALWPYNEWLKFCSDYCVTAELMSVQYHNDLEQQCSSGLLRTFEACITCQENHSLAFGTAKDTISSISSECMQSSYSIGPIASSIVSVATASFATVVALSDSVVNTKLISGGAITATGPQDSSSSTPTKTSAMLIVTEISTASIVPGQSASSITITAPANGTAATVQATIVVSNFKPSTSTTSVVTSASASHTSARTAAANKARARHEYGVLAITIVISLLLMQIMN